MSRTIEAHMDHVSELDGLRRKLRAFLAHMDRPAEMLDQVDIIFQPDQVEARDVFLTAEFSNLFGQWMAAEGIPVPPDPMG